MPIPEEWIDSLQWVDENLDFDTLVIGHPPVSGTKENVGQVAKYLEDLMASVTAARDAGLADNSPEMVEAVRPIWKRITASGRTSRSGCR